MDNKSQPTDWTPKVLAGLILFIVIMLTKTIITINFASFTNLYILPIAALFLAILVIAAIKFISIYTNKNYIIKKLRSSLSVILMLGGISLFIGIYRYVAELYSAANSSIYSAMFGIITTVIRNDNTVFFSGVTKAVQSTAVIIVSIYVAILTGIIWFFLDSKVKQLEMV